MRKLSSQILMAQLVILAATIVIGFLLFAYGERAHLDRQYEARAGSIASAVSAVPSIRSCMAHEVPGCTATIQDIATTIRSKTGASYVVVIDMHRVRHSHPNPALIGQPVTEPIVTVDGQVHLGADNGSTGRSANGKAPLYSPAGRMVGEVSVGIKESSVSSALAKQLPSYATWFAIALALGTLASFGLAAHLKRRTFGLELDEISQLLQEREGMLHGIREGVIAFDRRDRVSVVNDEAQRLLGLRVSAIGQHLNDVLPDGRLRDALAGRGIRGDDIVLTDDLCLVINRMPVTVAGRPHGAVVTLRDRTEVAGLRSELDGERGLTDSLRAQQHEFANRLHAVAGLLQLGYPDEALDYVLQIQGTAADFDNSLRTHIEAPQIVGLLLGKAAEASERGIDLVIAPETWLSESPEKVQALTSILGNLIDNAFAALATVPAPRSVVIAIVEDEREVVITVADNGPGIPEGSERMIFRDGYSTNDQAGARPRGLGLALVERLVTKLGGSTIVSGGPGATFTVRLPVGQSAVSVGSGAPE